MCRRGRRADNPVPPVYVVEVDTLIVSVVLAREVNVKLCEPTEATVPKAVGRAPAAPEPGPPKRPGVRPPAPEGPRCATTGEAELDSDDDNRYAPTPTAITSSTLRPRRTP